MMKPMRMRWSRHVKSIRKRNYACRVVVGKPEEKSTNRRPRRRLEDHIKMDLRGIGWGCGLDSFGPG
jgi:hypothetical protein